MKIFVGTVKRVNNTKTAFVEVASYWMHPIYKKKQKVTSVFACHDELGVEVGQSVKIGECRPISKTKRFKVLGKEEVK